MPEDRNSPDFVFYVPKTKISDLVRISVMMPTTHTDRHTIL